MPFPQPCNTKINPFAKLNNYFSAHKSMSAQHIVLTIVTGFAYITNYTPVSVLQFLKEHLKHTDSSKKQDSLLHQPAYAYTVICM